MKKYGMSFRTLKKKRKGKYKRLNQEEVDTMREKRETKTTRRKFAVKEEEKKETLVEEKDKVKSTRRLVDTV